MMGTPLTPTPLLLNWEILRVLGAVRQKQQQRPNNVFHVTYHDITVLERSFRWARVQQLFSVLQGSSELGPACVAAWTHTEAAKKKDYVISIQGCS